MSNTKAQIGNRMETVTMKFIEDEFDVLFKTREPILLIGMPGVGKTEIIRSLVRKLINQNQLPENGFFSVDFSQVPQEGIAMPYLDTSDPNEKVKRDIMSELKQLASYLKETEKEQSPAVFFIDEFTSAIQDDQRTLMNFVNDGKLPNGDELDNDRVFFVIAGNPSSEMPGYEDYDGATHPIENAVVTRGGTFFVVPDLDSWLDWGALTSSEKPEEYNLHPYLQAAIRNFRSLYMQTSENDIRLLNSRTGKKLSNYFYAANEMKRTWRAETIKAFVGDEVGSKIASTIANYDKLVSIEELFGPDTNKKLNGPALTKFKKMDEYEKFYVLMTLVSNQSKIKFTKRNNVVKLKALLEQGEPSNESIAALSSLIYSTNKNDSKSNASGLLATKWLNDDEVDLQTMFLDLRKTQAQVH